MPKLEYFLVCESLAVDQETNRVSLFNIFEELRPAAQQTASPLVTQMVAICCWIRREGDEGKDFQQVLRIHSPGEKPTDFPMNFVMEKERHRLFVRMQGVPAQRSGILRFEVLLNGEHFADHIITVHPNEPASTSTVAAEPVPCSDAKR